MADNVAVTGLATPLPIQHSGRDFYSRHLQIQCHQIRSDADVCIPIGEIDRGTEPLLQHALATLQQQAPPLLIVDLSQVDFLSVPGAQLLHTTITHPPQHHGHITLTALSRAATRAWAVAGYSTSVPTHPSVGHALDHVATATVPAPRLSR